MALAESQIKALRLMDLIKTDWVMLDFPLDKVTREMVKDNLFYAWAVLDKAERHRAQSK